jgi:hypothetical protein
MKETGVKNLVGHSLFDQNADSLIQDVPDLDLTKVSSCLCTGLLFGTKHPTAKRR